jgi:UPF0755 protein
MSGDWYDGAGSAGRSADDGPWNGQQRPYGFDTQGRPVYPEQGQQNPDSWARQSAEPGGYGDSGSYPQTPPGYPPPGYPSQGGGGGGRRRRAQPAAADAYGTPQAPPPGFEPQAPPPQGGGGRRRAGARQQPDPRPANPYDSGAHQVSGHGDPRYPGGPGGASGYAGPHATTRQTAPPGPDSGGWDQRQVPGPRQFRSPEGPGTPRVPDPRVPDPRMPDPRVPDPRAGGPRTADPGTSGRRRAPGAPGERSGGYARQVPDPRGGEPYGRRSGGYDMPSDYDRPAPDAAAPRGGRRQGYDTASDFDAEAPRRGRRRHISEQDGAQGRGRGERGYAEERDNEPYDDEHQGSDTGSFGLFGGDEGSGDGKRGKRKGGKRKRGGAAVLLAIVVVFAILGGIGYEGYAYYKKEFGPPPDFASTTGLPTTIEIQVNPGESVTQIGQTLVQDGVVESLAAWTKAADANIKSQNIQPGLYMVHKGLSAASAINALLDSNNLDDKSRIMVTAGQWSSEVFATLSQKTGWSLSSIQAAAKSGKVDLPTWAGNNIEGFLAPGTYNLGTKGLTPTSLLKQMVDNSLNEFNQAGVTQTTASKLGLKSPEDLLIIASLARAEAKYTGDLPKVAQVIYNRLNDPSQTGGHLQFDTPVLYGLGKRDVDLTRSQLYSSSNKYSDFVYKGLPPGPIDNPDVDSLKAAVNPTGGTKIQFFCTINLKTGDTQFVDTYAELQDLENKYPDCNK